MQAIDRRGFSLKLIMVSKQSKGEGVAVIFRVRFLIFHLLVATYPMDSEIALSAKLEPWLSWLHTSKVPNASSPGTKVTAVAVAVGRRG